MKVLFVDDDLLTAEWVEIYLKSNNIETKMAASVPAAIECLREWLPDLIVSDLNFDGDHAFTLLDHLASNERTIHIPVVAMTGYALEHSETQRFHGYLHKPVEPEQLLKLINDVKGRA